MSDPKEQQREGDELDLKAETISDLEPAEQEEEQVRGGACGIHFKQPTDLQG